MKGRFKKRKKKKKEKLVPDRIGSGEFDIDRLEMEEYRLEGELLFPRPEKDKKFRR